MGYIKVVKKLKNSYFNLSKGQFLKLWLNYSQFLLMQISH